MKKFYLGMDIGTNSVGIACTDENYRLLRTLGKDCWAVRLFPEGSTAEGRRMLRTARRRLERRKQRIGFLQALFAPYIDDELFFIRLNNSAYFADDKAEILGGDKNSLFADGAYTDKQYHSDFPTVYHLRSHLQSKPFSDLRLYYLAIHHIVKYRGHFLFNGGMDEVRDVKRLFNELNDVCSDLYSESEVVPAFSIDCVHKAKDILLDSRMGLRDKQASLETLFGKDVLIKEIIKGISGGKISPKILFGEEYQSEKSFSFRDLTDEAFEAMQITYGDGFVLLEKIKAVYSFIVFEKLLDGQPNISAAMINLYQTHKKDLQLLKKFLRENASENVYRNFFKSAKEKANYVNYVGYTKKGGDKIKVKLCKDAEFFAELKKLILSLNDVKDEVTKQEILQRIESGDFLPKILHSDNGLFPHQVNEEELIKIIDNMVASHPKTQEIADKILSVFRFKIPYYVGPLTGENSWVVRSSEKITPWNFDEVVDKAKSNESFMRRMTGKCAYLHCQDVLPKCSITYQKYDVLNQLNKLRINDVPISVSLKQKLFCELFMKRKKVTDRTIISFLIKEGIISEAEKGTVKLTGKEGDFKASLSSYIQLKEILGDFVDEDLRKGSGVCENIILWHTLNTDKNIVIELIQKNYGKIEEIKTHLKELKGLSFQKFGRLSQKLLTGLTVSVPSIGENLCVLDLMYETNGNLNEILNDGLYKFSELIREENGETSEEVRYEDLEKLYISPAVRRGVWQSLCMADEYVKAIGSAPDKIFVEVTREDGVKGDLGRTQSRKRRLLDLYKKIGGNDEYDEVFKELEDEGITDLKLRQERLYLYFRQLGRCMYSGQRIDLSRLNTDLYDVDHILPRTYIKDDSLDNKVLVLRSKNAEKRDIYPLPHGFSNEQAFWKLLLQKGLIGDLTYNRLTRTEQLGEDDYNSFINRQKTITDQTAKVVAELLKRKYPNSKIVYSKAKNVSDFKNKFDLFKCRITNDLHHARDAYLNIVVGNVFDTCFSSPLAMFRKDGDVWRTYNLKTMFMRNVDGAWDESSLSTVKAVFSKCSMCVTRYAYSGKGGFYDQTVYSCDDSRSKIPRKGSGPLNNTQRYGGYNKLAISYFAIVQSEGENGKLIKTIEAIPVLVCKQKDLCLIDYLKEKGLKNPKILVPKIKSNQLVSYNGMPVYITGISDAQILVQNAVQLFTDNKTDEYVKALSEFYERNKTDIEKMTEEVYIIKTNRMCEIKLKIDGEKNDELYNYLVAKLDNKIYDGLGYCATFRKLLTDGYETFKTLTVAKQVKVLLQILNFFQCNAQLSDLQLIGGSKLNGKLRFSNNITDVDFKIIYQSHCGLTVRERKV